MPLRPGSPLIGLLTSLRDSRLVWDIFGVLYNRRVEEPLAPLYNLLGEEVRALASRTILDVGCGPGYLTRHLAALCPEADVQGVDYSTGQIRFARRVYLASGEGRVKFIRGNALALPFPDGAFDVVVSVGSIKHWHDPHRGLAEIRRVLRPEGVLFLSETDREATDEAIRSFMVRFGLALFPDSLMFWGLRNIVFGRSFSLAELTAMVTRAGFDVTTPLAATVCPYNSVKAS